MSEEEIEYELGRPFPTWDDQSRDMFLAMTHLEDILAKGTRRIEDMTICVSEARLRALQSRLRLGCSHWLAEKQAELAALRAPPLGDE